jgi:hypothetical protein
MPSLIANARLLHDDFRGPEENYRSVHDDWRRSYDHDFRMTTVPAMPVPSAFGNKASTGTEEAENAG